MSIVQAYELEGHVLTFNSDDIEQFSTPVDVIKVSETERELGKRHLNLTFKEGSKSPYWVKKEASNG